MTNIKSSGTSYNFSLIFSIMFLLFLNKSELVLKNIICSEILMFT